MAAAAAVRASPTMMRRAKVTPPGAWLGASVRRAILLVGNFRLEPPGQDASRLNARPAEEPDKIAAERRARAGDGDHGRRAPGVQVGLHLRPGRRDDRRSPGPEPVEVKRGGGPAVAAD